MLKQEPAFFDAAGLDGRASTSPPRPTAPGCRTSWSAPAGATAGPTLLYGYGGFEVSLTPQLQRRASAAPGWPAAAPTWWPTSAAAASTGPLAPGRAAGEPAAGVRGLRRRRRATWSRAGITDPAAPRHRGRQQRRPARGRHADPVPGAVRRRRRARCRCWTCAATTTCSPARRGWPSTATRTTRPTGRSCDGSRRTRTSDSGQAYPPALFITSTRDDRVHPGHARKMAARLRELGHDVTYYENIEGGHGGAADNAQLAFRMALGLRVHAGGHARPEAHALRCGGVVRTVLTMPETWPTLGRGAATWSDASAPCDRGRDLVAAVASERLADAEPTPATRCIWPREIMDSVGERDAALALVGAGGEGGGSGRRRTDLGRPRRAGCDLAGRDGRGHGRADRDAPGPDHRSGHDRATSPGAGRRRTGPRWPSSGSPRRWRPSGPSPAPTPPMTSRACSTSCTTTGTTSATSSSCRWTPTTRWPSCCRRWPRTMQAGLVFWPRPSSTSSSGAGRTHRAGGSSDWDQHRAIVECHHGRAGRVERVPARRSLPATVTGLVAFAAERDGDPERHRGARGLRRAAGRPAGGLAAGAQRGVLVWLGSSSTRSAACRAPRVM